MFFLSIFPKYPKIAAVVGCIFLWNGTPSYADKKPQMLSKPAQVRPHAHPNEHLRKQHLLHLQRLRAQRLAKQAKKVQQTRKLLHHRKLLQIRYKHAKQKHIKAKRLHQRHRWKKLQKPRIVLRHKQTQKQTKDRLAYEQQVRQRREKYAIRLKQEAVKAKQREMKKQKGVALPTRAEKAQPPVASAAVTARQPQRHRRNYQKNPYNIRVLSANRRPGYPYQQPPPPPEEIRKQDLQVQVNNTTGRMQIPQSVVTMYENHPHLLRRGVSAIPFYRQGKPLGFLLANVEEDSVVYRVGFRQGDIVIRVNGYATTSYVQASLAYFALRNQKSFHIQLIRNGQNHSHYVDIQ